ncbi:MAG: class I SAM-dependent methyltransferase [Planctomycetota bacterium]
MFIPSHPDIYDSIGDGYGSNRVADPRIYAVIRSALEGCRTVVNIGAGVGSYEPEDLQVTAVEPSSRMIEQRLSKSRVVQAVAEELPIQDLAFDASMAVLTVHHWTDPGKGLSEMARVSRRQVIFTFDPDIAFSFWLMRDYFPGLIETDVDRSVSIDAIKSALGEVDIRTVNVPRDCTDGFLAAYWRRPERYLVQSIRNSISTFSQIDDRAIQPGIEALQEDLRSGAWNRKYADLLERDELDCGYRLIIAGDRQCLA